MPSISVRLSDHEYAMLKGACEILSAKGPKIRATGFMRWALEQKVKEVLDTYEPEGPVYLGVNSPIIT